MRLLRTSLALFIPGVIACAPAQQKARVGDLPLQNGATLTDCVVSYRTFGQLNASRSNAVLVLPWYQGTSIEVARHIGRGRLVDSSTDFVIAVDALGNGLSSSPSNTARQPGGSFPLITIADIVESEFRLVTRTLGLSHLKAVVGISMGGMQVFEWITAHPDFMDKAVTVVGSPQTQEDDRARWSETIAWLRSTTTWTRVKDPLLHLRPRATFAQIAIHPGDHISQAQAIMALDVTRRFGGSMDRAAAAIRAQLFVVGTWADREVNPAPGFAFAKLAHAEVLELDGRCGHQAPSCDRDRLWTRVRAFLTR